MLANRPNLTRRRLLTTGVVAAAGAVLAACAAPAAPTATPQPAKPAAPAAAPTTAPAAAAPTTAPAAAPAAAATATTAPAAAAAPAAKPTEAAKPAAPAAAAGNRQFNGAWPYQMPPAGHWNMYVPNRNNLGIYRDLIEQPFGMYYWADKKWLPLLATEWKFAPPDWFEVTIREGVKFSDGKDFTTQDVITSFTVGRIENWTIWRYIDRIEAQGNKVRFHMHNPSTVVERYIIRGEPDGKIVSHAIYGDWAKRVDDLVKAGKDSNSDEFKKLREEFRQFRPKEMIGTGPFRVDLASMTESQLTLVKVPTSWSASKVQFDKIVLYNGETPAVTPVVLAKNVDYATHGFPPATEKAFIDQGIRILRAPVYTGPALLFNFETMKAIRPKEARQAIAHAFKRDDAAAVALGKSAIPPKFMAGFSDLLVPQWLSEADQAKLNKYEYNPDKAASILKEIGYNKGSDGIWVSKDGEKMEYELAVPAEFADNSAAAVSIGEQLTKFGIKTTVRTVTFTQFPIELDAGKYQMAVDGWGSANPHPHFSFDQNLFVRNTPKAPGGGIKFPLKQQTSQGELDLEKMTIESAQGLDENAQKALVTKLALAYNELMPKIPIYERYGNNPTAEGVRLTGWPADTDPIFKNSPYADAFTTILMYEGKLVGKGTAGSGY